MIGYGMDADASVDRADDVVDAREMRAGRRTMPPEERCEDAVDRQEDALKDEGDYAVFDGSWIASTCTSCSGWRSLPSPSRAPPGG